jgi:hypothetical protein
MMHILFLWDEDRPTVLCGAPVRILPNCELSPAGVDFIGDCGLVTVAQAAKVDCPTCRMNGDLVVNEERAAELVLTEDPEVAATRGATWLRLFT